MLDKECSDGHLRRISSLIPDWLTYAKALGFTEPDTRDITDNPQLSNSTHAMKALRVLEKWHLRYAFNATYYQLIEVCLDVGHAAIATKICEVVKGWFVLLMLFILLSFLLTIEGSSRPLPITGDKRKATEHTEQGETVSCCVGLFYWECLHAVPPKRPRSEEQ